MQAEALDFKEFGFNDTVNKDLEKPIERVERRCATSFTCTLEEFNTWFYTCPIVTTLLKPIGGVEEQKKLLHDNLKLHDQANALGDSVKKDGWFYYCHINIKWADKDGSLLQVEMRIDIEEEKLHGLYLDLDRQGTPYIR